MSGPPIRVGSRGSVLALAQAALVGDAFEAAGRSSTIVVIETDGDRRVPDTAWGEGAFVAAIEQALLDDRVDVAVHSAKDLPTDEDARLRIVACLPRADARDALVIGGNVRGTGIDDLPPGTRVGTDSPRRTAFLRARRPDLSFHPIHGNVDTRLRRLDAGETDALVLACAGLDRLGRSDRIAERLDPVTVPPAPGQGAIAIQARADDPDLGALGAIVDHAPTRAAVEAERAFLRVSGGGCRAPIGAYAIVGDAGLDLLGAYLDPDGLRVVIGRREGPADTAAAVGEALATEIGVHRLRGSGSAVATTAHPGRVGGSSARVLVTRGAAQAGELVEAIRGLGLEAVPVPTIAVDLLSGAPAVDDAVRQLSAYTWVVVTSPNGAQAVTAGIARLARSGVSTTPARYVRWAALGPGTRAVLEAAGIQAAFVPDEHGSPAIAAGLPINPGDRVLVARGDLAADDLATALRLRGAVVDDVVAYRTVEAPGASRGLLRAAFDGGPLAAVVFTSGSTVRGLSALARSLDIDPTAIPTVCIGRPTADAARLAGFNVLAVAPSPEPSVLARTLAGALADRQQEIA